MKKLIYILIGAFLLGCFMPLAAGSRLLAQAALPFALNAPENAGLVWLNGEQGHTSMQFSYGIGDDLREFLAISEQARISRLNALGYEALNVSVQIDWAIDDPNDWHYNEYWDGASAYGVGYDEDGNYRLGVWDVASAEVTPDSVNIAWIMGDIDDPANPENVDWNGDGYMPGLKDELKEGQYSIETDEYGNSVLKIDYTKHTIYARARLSVLAVKPDGAGEARYFSPWSQAAAYGRDAKQEENAQKLTLDAPKISALRVTGEEYNAYPVLAYTLTVTDALQKTLSEVQEAGGFINLLVEARISGRTDWVQLDADRTVGSGELAARLQMLAETSGINEKAQPIELRARFFCERPGAEPVYSEYSEILTVTADLVPTRELPAINTPTPERGGRDESGAEKCTLCGVCSEPLGLCIFVWLFALAVIAVLIIVVLKRRRRR